MKTIFTAIASTTIIIGSVFSAARAYSAITSAATTSTRYPVTHNYLSPQILQKPRKN